MNRTEVATLLMKACAIDKRTLGETDVIAWHEILSPFKFDDAEAALKAHFTNSMDYLTPAHIVAGCRRIANDRYQRALPREESWVPCPPNAEYLAAKAEMIRKSKEKMRNI